MAALVFCVCSALDQLYDWAGAFVRFGYDPFKSFVYLRAKNREIRYRLNCRDIWLQELSKRTGLPKETVRVLIVRRRALLRNTSNLERVGTENMHRSGIDFAAIEASAAAYEAIDSFAVQSRRSIDETDQATRGSHGYDVMGNFDDIEVLTPDEINTTFYEYANAVPVYQNTNIGDLKEGMSFTFLGYILLNCERFSINFVIENEHRDVALHINPRLPQNYIVRNTKVKDVWGTEEVSSALPFSLKRGAKFAIQVLVTELSFLISVNGTHFAKYDHRLPFTAVKTVEVKGDVDNVNMDIATVRRYPDYVHGAKWEQIRLAFDEEDFEFNKDEAAKENEDYKASVESVLIPAERRATTLKSAFDLSPSLGISMPYYGHLKPGLLKVGRCLRIIGRAKLLPHSFYINLQTGKQFWPHPKVAFHFNPRFSKQVGAIGKAIVCRNSWYDGKWAKEERSELDTDFRPGKTFRLVIVCAQEGFEVFLNNKLITEYKYHLEPTIVDTVYIQGDIKLYDVVLQSNISEVQHQQLYVNPHKSPKASIH